MEQGLDIRVSKAYGSRGYDKVRLSVISNESISSEYFTYSELFKYRWTTNVLNTGLVTVTPGEKTTLTIAGQEVHIKIPREDEPVRGVVVADPCITSDYVWCTYREEFDTYNRSSELLNAIHSHEDTDFWMILGDNFYDPQGDATASWFATLSPETKSKVFGSVPGNHDFWIMSSPIVALPKDQLGNAFMQWYGQDVASASYSTSSHSHSEEEASTTATGEEKDGAIGVNVRKGAKQVLESPYDFSVDPDAPDADGHSLPPAGDFFWYYKLGNAGFISYSGGHSYDAMEAYFEEACAYLTSSNVQAVMLMGHWNTPGLGCSSDMNVPATYKELLQLPVCQALEGKMRYFEGHTHCNTVVEENVGFMVAGQGMTSEHLECDGNYGLPVVDTHDGFFRVYYFDIAQVNEYDNYDTILQCIKDQGVSNCYHLATLWASVPLQQ